MNNRLRQQYLEEIGIQSWLLKSALDDDCIETEIVQEPQLYNKVQSDEEPQPCQKPQPDQEPQADYLTENLAAQPAIDSIAKSISPGIETESKKAVASPPVKSIDDFTVDQNLLETKVIENIEHESDSELGQNIKLCKKCPSRITRLNALTGEGNTRASVFIIAGAPNAEEDRLGRYLIEQSNTLFQRMLHSTGLEHDYFFTGQIKCHSMEDFRYSEQDILNCKPYLHAQIEQAKPSVLLVLGAAEAQSLLTTKQSFNELHGKIHHIRINDKDYRVIISYHPAYLLRNPLYKKESLNDLVMVKNLLNEF